MAVQRRLAAILAADVAGYSRLMGEDEDGTRDRFNAHLAELIEPAIASRRGRIVKITGDALLVEFASVVDAVDAPSKSKKEWRNVTPMSRTTGAWSFASASILAT